ncbi:MAG: glycerophosphodiester phosphodiesterase [Candidatus Neomarinimicrobiota bacterium]
MSAGLLGLILLLGGGVMAVCVRRLWFWRAREVRFYPRERMLYLAHRGVPSRAPENTLPSFLAAFEAGMDGIELDVMQTSDGELIVKHDYDLERVTEGSGYVWETSYEVIAGLNASYRWQGDYPPTRIPRLEEVLELVPEGVLINIELKARRWFNPGFEERVVALVRRYQLVERTIISSFNPFSLVKVRRLEPALVIGLNWWNVDTPWYLRKLYIVNLVHPDLLHPSVDVVTPEMVARAHRRGMRVNVWTVNNRPVIQYLKSIGVDGIFTDFPELVFQPK